MYVVLLRCAVCLRCCAWLMGMRERVINNHRLDKHARALAHLVGTEGVFVFLD